MHGIITNQQLLVRHPQWNPQNVFDEAHDQACPHDIPADDEHGACNLVADLHAISRDRTAGICDGKRRRAGDSSEDTSGAPPDDPGDKMGVEDTKDVINGAHEWDLFAEYVHGEPRDGTGSKTHGDRTPARHDTCGRGDGNKAADHAIDGADDGGFAVVSHVAKHPAEHAHCGADVRVQHRDARVDAGGIGVPAVEAVPAQPEDACSDQDRANVVGAVVFAVSVQAGSDPPCADEACGPGGEMDHVASRVIDHAEDGQKAAAPDGVGHDAVGEGQPEGHVDDPSEEVHAAQKSARRDDERDGCEDELEVYHDGHWEICADAGGW